MWLSGELISLRSYRRKYHHVTLHATYILGWWWEFQFLSYFWSFSVNETRFDISLTRDEDSPFSMRWRDCHVKMVTANILPYQGCKFSHIEQISSDSMGNRTVSTAANISVSPGNRLFVSFCVSIYILPPVGTCFDGVTEFAEKPMRFGNDEIQEGDRRAQVGKSRKKTKRKWANNTSFLFFGSFFTVGSNRESSINTIILHIN